MEPANIIGHAGNMTSVSPWIEAFRSDGFFLLKGVIEPQILDDIESTFKSIVAPYYPIESRGLHSAAFASWLSIQTAGMQARLYDRMRSDPIIRSACLAPCITDHVLALLRPSGMNMTNHCRFRMDQPLDTRWLAAWHQDLWYTNTRDDAITAWFPLQDTSWLMGPLAVLPGSHKLGALMHDVEINGRKCPLLSFTHRTVKLVEMHRGDLLLFHSLLLHSGQINLSDKIRFSVQGRFEPI